MVFRFYDYFFLTTILESHHYPPIQVLERHPYILARVMNAILRALRVHRQKPATTRLFTPVDTAEPNVDVEVFEETQEPLPSLPIELWLTILEIALRPRLILDLEFEPVQLQLAIFSLADPFYGGEAAARKIIAASKRHLRPVCRAWKEIVDNLHDLDECVMEKYYRSDAPRTNTRQCEKLHLSYSLKSDSGIKVRYTHPVPTVSLKIGTNVPDLGAIPIKTLDEIIPFTDHLHVLSLDLQKCEVSGSVLGDIQMRGIPLTTLRLFLDQFDLLYIPLEIPTLYNLFLSIPTYDKQRWNRPLSSLPWKFRELRALSLVDRREDLICIPYDIHPFLMEILRNHFEGIRALQIDPMPKELVDHDSPLCWASMPKLRAFATNHYPMSKVKKEQVSKANSPIKKLSSVQHLIVADTLIGFTDDVLLGLQSYIDACDKIESICFAGGGQLSNIGWDTKALKRLQALCDRNNILLKDLYGNTGPRRNGI
jgi:hypothetical protein